MINHLLKPWIHPRPQYTRRILLVAMMLWCVQNTASACGYHDPTTIKTGMLNWIYPKSLYVTGAIWKSQQAGILPPPDVARLSARGSHRKFLDLLAYQRTVKALQSLGAGLDAVKSDGHKTNLSLVLVETALWTQFSDTGTHTRVEVDADGPRADDLVVVTGEPVLYALKEGQLSLLRAVELGVIRLYGTPEQISNLLDEFGTIGDLPLPAADQATQGFGGSVTTGKVVTGNTRHHGFAMPFGKRTPSSTSRVSD